MKLIETCVAETTVRMRFADNADATKASEWIDFQLPTANLKRESDTRISTPALVPLGAIRVAALQHVRDVIDEEIRNAQGQLDRNRR